MNKDTWEVYDGQRRNESAAFRAYDSVSDFYKDQDLLLQQPRYRTVREASTPEEQAWALQRSGYATDPAYASKLLQIIARYGLRRYDREAGLEAEENRTVTIEVNGSSLVTGYIIDGLAWGPARAIGTSLDAQVGWNGREVTLNGETLPTRRINGLGYVPVRRFAESLGADVEWDGMMNTVRILK